MTRHRRPRLPTTVRALVPPLLATALLAIALSAAAAGPWASAGGGPGPWLSHVAVLVRASGPNCPRGSAAAAELIMPAARESVVRRGPFCLGDVGTSTALSPNGKLFAFSDPAGQMVIAHLDSGIRVILGHGTVPSFSHDSRYLAFTLLSGAVRVDMTSPTRPRVVRVGRTHGYLAGEVSWAHKSDMLAGLFEGRLNVPGFVRMSRPSQVVIAAEPNGIDDSDSAWSWDDRGLLYWSYLGNELVLAKWSLGNHQTRSLATAKRPCGKTCQRVTPPVAIPGGAIFTQWAGVGMFGTMRDGKLSTTVAVGTPYATLESLALAPSGSEALLGWAGPSGKSRIGLWRVGAHKVWPLCRALQAFWVEGDQETRPAGRYGSV